MPKIKLSDYVFQFIAELGVRHVFTLVGGGAMHLDDSLGGCRDIEYVCNLHEQACAIAAEAYAKVTNNLGVALVTTGPGGTNTITGLVGAWQDSTPCLFLSGQVKRSDLMSGKGVRQMGVQEVDIVSLVRSVTKYACTITDPSTIKYHLEKGVFLARTGRPGPVWIDIPLDVQASFIEPERLVSFDSKEIVQTDNLLSLRKQINEIIYLLNTADRPILLAGNGIRLSGAQADFGRLVDLLNIPVLLTWPAMDLLPEAHAHLAGRPGSAAPRGANFSLQNSDLLIALGTRLDLVLTGFAPERFARGAKKVVVDVDPNELNKLNHITDLAVCADVATFLREFLTQAETVHRKDRFQWVNRCQDWKKRYPIVLPEHREPSGKVSCYYLTEVLSDVLQPDDVIVPGSSGFGIEIFLLAFKVKEGQRIFNTTALGAMGFGLPAAIGACIASGGRRTICVDGDGGFQMNIQELETLRRLNLPIKCFVLNNDGYSSIMAMQERYFGRLMGSDANSGMTLADIVRVASSYGLTTYRIMDQSNLKSEIENVLEMPGPVICDVLIRTDEKRAPSLSSVQKPDGSMISKPLEDLWPFLERSEFLSNMIVPPIKED
ncbi:MAG: thiamine pyrophosphate-binding protein [Syntrophales bacterium]